MLTAGAAALAGTVSAQPAQGRGSASPPPTVLNLGSLAIAVQNLDASVAFYRDGLALDLVAPPTAASVDGPRRDLLDVRCLNALGIRLPS